MTAPHVPAVVGVAPGAAAPYRIAGAQVFELDGKAVGVFAVSRGVVVLIGIGVENRVVRGEAAELQTGIAIPASDDLLELAIVGTAPDAVVPRVLDRQAFDVEIVGTFVHLNSTTAGTAPSHRHTVEVKNGRFAWIGPNVDWVARGPAIVIADLDSWN